MRVEGVHGEAKTWHGLARAIRRGLANMRIQAFLTAVVINLKRLAAAILIGLLADPRLVLAPELDLGLGVALRHVAQRAGEAPFLNSSCAAPSALGWRGRVFCEERSSALTSRRMPPSR